MANFDDFQSIFRALTKEREEANVTQQQFESVARTEISKSIDLLKARNEDLAAASSEKARILDGLETKLTRIEEINADPMLQIIEPLAGAFSTQFSRAKLARQMRADESKLQLVDRRAAIKEAQRAAEADISQAKVRQAQFESQAEAQDVAALRARLGDLTALRTELSAQETRALEKASDEELQNVVTGRVKAGKFNAAQARREILGRRARQLSVDIAEINVEASRRAALESKIQTLEEADLEAMVKSGEVTPVMRDEELGRRRARRNALIAAEQAIVTNDAALLENVRKEFVRTMTDEELEIAIEKAAETGVAVFPVGDKELRFTLRELVDRRSQGENTRLQLATDKVLTETADTGAKSAARAAARATGIGTVTATDPKTTQFVFDEMAADETLPSDIRNQAGVAASLYRQAEEAKKNGADAQEAALRNAAFKTAQQVEELAKARKLETTPKDVKPAMTEYLDKGVVEQQANAITAVRNALLAGESTGSTLYDQSLATILASEKLLQNAQVTALKFTDPEEFIARLLGDADVRSTAAAQAMDVAIGDLYERVALLLGDEQLSAMLSNSGSMIYTNGRLSQTKMFEFLAKRPTGPGGTGVNLEAFIAALRRESGKHFDEVTRPAGTSAAMQASINKLLFDNLPAQFMQIELSKRIREASRPPVEVKRSIFEGAEF